MWVRQLGLSLCEARDAGLGCHVLVFGEALRHRFGSRTFAKVFSRAHTHAHRGVQAQGEQQPAHEGEPVQKDEGKGNNLMLTQLRCVNGASI